MKKLKKIVLKIPINPSYQDFFDLLTKYELLQIHRFDDIHIYATQRFKFKNKDFNPKNLQNKFGIEFIEILAKDTQKNEFICLVKHRWYEELRNFFKDSEILIEPPIIMEDDSLIITYITPGANIDSIIDLQKNIYGDNYKILSINSVQPNRSNLNLLLTERQKEIIYYSVEHGYYDIPRKTNSETIANHFGISKSAFCEHLRKIERTIFFSIFK